MLSTLQDDKTANSTFVLSRVTAALYQFVLKSTVRTISGIVAATNRDLVKPSTVSSYINPDRHFRKRRCRLVSIEPSILNREVGLIKITSESN